MRSPSLRRRAVAAGVGTVVAVLVALDVFVYLSFRSTLHAELEAVLDQRAAIVRAEAGSLPPEALAARLTQLGIVAKVRGPDGRVFESNPPSPRLPALLPPPDRDAGERVFREVALPGGSTATVSASTSGVERSLARLVVLEIAGTVAGALVAGLLIGRLADAALRPLRTITDAAHRTAAGVRGERLRPDRPGTELGRAAAAYDQMLDALEAALQEARDAQARMQQLEARARRVVETAADAFVAVDVDGAIVEWNDRARTLFGWRREEVLGRAVTELLAPELRPLVDKAVRRLRERGEWPLPARHFQLAGVRRDGRHFPIEVTAWATVDAAGSRVNAFVQDITRRKEAAAAARRLAAIVESSDDAIIGKDLDGTIRTWNRGAERMYGYTADEIIGRSIHVLVPPELHGEVDGYLERIRRGEHVEHRETERLTKRGGRIEIALTVSPIHDERGNVVGISTIGRDITEQRWMAKTLDRTLGALAAALEEARQSEERTRRFLADAAHQLRSPLAGIRASAETLLRGASLRERDKLLANLVRETSRATRLISSLLRMARLEEGVPLEPVPTDVVAMCADEVDRTATLAPDLRVEARVGALPAGLPVLDPNAVREILANLLDNARRYARQQIEVAVGEGTRGTIEIRVSNDGPPLPPELAERVFERFVSLDARKGSGLGLSIGRGLARAHGGDLTYEEGAFVLRLPADARDLERDVGVDVSSAG